MKKIGYAVDFIIRAGDGVDCWEILGIMEQYGSHLRLFRRIQFQKIGKALAWLDDEGVFSFNTAQDEVSDRIDSTETMDRLLKAQPNLAYAGPLARREKILIVVMF